MAQTQKIVADKIIAQVGDKIILKSDIDNAIADYKRAGQDAQLPPNPECAFLEGQLIQKALVLQAQKDSLPLSDEDVDALLDNQIRGFIQQYGSQQALEDIAGRTVYQIKEDFREPLRERKLADDMRTKILSNVKITPTEVKEYFDKIPADSLRFYESQLEVSQIVLYPKANKDVEAYVINQLNEWKKEVESGQQKFDALAKLYSDDPGSKDNGGQYSINRNDKQWDPTFLAAAFKLKEGQISPVIKSKFGYHIIQMVSRAGDDAVIRHILRIPPVTDDEIKIAQNKLDSIRSKIISGSLTFNEAVNKYSEDENSKFNAGAITAPDQSTYVTIDQLDKDLVVALKNMKVGQVSQPLPYTDERGTKAIRIVYLKTETQPHRENLKDDYNKIAARALDEKKQQVLEKWFADHIPTYYINIDKSYTGCKNINQWWSASNTANK
ncbi:MAG: peptidylprolyl isomerase [Chitinophagaceae bacterium]